MPSIIIRAANPAAAAETLRAIGVELERPNRPNPTRWHGSCRLTVSVLACEPGEEPSVALGSAEMDGLRARLPVGATGERGVKSADGTLLVDIGGLSVPVLADAGPVARPALDRGMLPHAAVIIEDAGDELAAALPRLRVRNPRLVGPALMLGRIGRVFTLVVDGGGEAAIAELNAILARHAHPAMRIDARSAASLDPEALARVDLLAWDVDL